MNEFVEEAMDILRTARPIFETARRQQVETPSMARASSSEDLGAVADQLQSILISRDKEVAEKKLEVRKMMFKKRPESIERIRAGLRMRSVGLAELFDQAVSPSEAN